MSVSGESGDERRGGDRIPINEEFSRDASTWVSDLSRGGVFVHSAELLPVGSLIELRFTVVVDELTIIEAVAKVVRHSRRPQGMGVEFVSLTPQMAEHIDALLAQRRPLDSGAPLRLPEPHQSDETTNRVLLARPAPASFEPVTDDDEEDATASYPRVADQLDQAAQAATSVFRPPPMPTRAGDDERTRQFPKPKPK